MIREMPFLRAGLLALAASALFAAEARPQYFGRNKVQYERFDWRILESEHFDLHGYEAMSDAALGDAGRMAERWYDRYQGLFDHRFGERKPLILYADKPDFQQTNTTPGFVSQSTGGFTEGLKDRVVLPFAEGYGETDHVLGHELVHAFQFDIAQSDSGAGPTGFLRLPLWFIEGMAEYLSLGRVDAHTAMWMRDAVQRGDLPTLDDLSRDPRYFPYRYGHAFWAYVAGTYGDNAVPALFKAAGQSGIDVAIEQTPDGTRLNYAGEESELLVRHRGEPIKALQHVVDMAYGRGLGGDDRVFVDALGYRKGKDLELRKMAKFLAEKARTSGVEQSIGPLNAYERRLVHLAVAEFPDVTSESIGDAAVKTVTISATKKQG